MERFINILLLSLALIFSSSCKGEVKEQSIKKIEQKYKDFDSSCSESGGIHPVSFIKVVSKPEVFKDYCVAITGYVRFEHESNYIYFNKEQYENFQAADAIFMSVPSESIERYKTLNGYVTTVIGKIRLSSIDDKDLFSKPILDNVMVKPEF